MKFFFLIGFISFYIFVAELVAKQNRTFDTVFLSEKIVPAVVDVYAYHDNNSDLFLPFELADIENMFFGESRQHAMTSSGTGVIIDEKGVLVTCAHVINSASKISIGFNDGRKLDAEVLYMNVQADIAFLKVQSKENLPYLNLAKNTTQVFLGEPVLVAGNAFGMGKTSVFGGMISFINRVIDKKVVLQSTANINVGNSGGPMVNAEGEMIGMAFAIPRAGGVSFFIPAVMIKYYYDTQILKKPASWWGVEVQAIDNKRLLESVGLKDKNFFGVIVTQCQENSPASSFLKPGDIIVKINGQKLATVEELDFFEKTSMINEKVYLTIWRNNQLQEVVLIPKKMPKNNKKYKKSLKTSFLKGIVFTQKQNGVVIEEVAAGSFFSGMEGGIVLEVNGHSSIKEVEDIESALKDTENTHVISLTVQKDNQILNRTFSG